MFSVAIVWDAVLSLTFDAPVRALSVTTFTALAPKSKVCEPTPEGAKTIVELFALNVSPVTVAIFHVVEPRPVSVHVPLPRLIVRVPAPVKLIPVAAETVTFLLFVAQSNVPVNAPAIISPMLRSTLFVTVPPPELPSKVATSPAFLGTPPVAAQAVPPPDVDFQCAASVELSHVPVPLTQKQVAASTEVATKQSNNAMTSRSIIYILCSQSSLKR